MDEDGLAIEYVRGNAQHVEQPAPYTEEEEELARPLLEAGDEDVDDADDSTALVLPEPHQNGLQLPAEMHGDLMFAATFLNSFRPQLKLNEENISIYQLDRTLGSRRGRCCLQPHLLLALSRA